MAKKPFKERKLGKILASKGLDQILGIVGDLVPGVAILDNIKDAILGNGSDEVNEAISILTPEERQQILELVKLEQQELDSILADKQSARAMQVAALGQDDLFSKRFTYYFITAWSLFSMAFILMTTLLEIPPANMRIVDTTQGVILGTAVASMFGFLLGSTHKSQQKDATISNLSK